MDTVNEVSAETLRERVRKAVYAELNFALTPEGNDDIDACDSLGDKVTAAVVTALDDETARLRVEVERVIRAGQAVARGATTRIETLTRERDIAEATLDRAREDAWDEGWVAGCDDQQYGDEDAKPWTPNPYPAILDPDE